MANRLLWVWLLLLPTALVQGQITGVFAEININHDAESNQGVPIKSQFALQNSVGLDIGKRFSAGIRIHHIWYRAFMAEGFETFRITGPFVRYGTRIGEKLRLFGSLGLSRGDFCTCGLRANAGDSFRQKGLSYFVWGGGLEARIHPGIYLNGELFSHTILNYTSSSLDYWGYVVGFVFHLRYFNLSSRA